MGGAPRWAVISLALPKNFSRKDLHSFYKGLSDCADEHEVSVVGGDTDQSPQGWKITLTLLGEGAHPIYRHGAKVGDQIWVTGNLGASALGLEILRRKKTNQKKSRAFTDAHLNPVARVQEGKTLSHFSLASAMIDVSDGLLQDLENLCKNSRVGAEIHSSKIPLLSHHNEIAQSLGKEPCLLALTGGEDYELLFTAPPAFSRKIESVFKKLNTKVSCVGSILPPKKGIVVRDLNGKRMKLKRKGYSHF